MTQMTSRLLLAALFVTAANTGAFAQAGGNFDVKTMNFDLWCQEQAHLPAERCDKRTPEDEKTFDAFRGQIEHYEIPYLQQKNNDVRLDTDILHNDPVDRSVTNDTRTQRQNSGTVAPAPTNGAQ